MTPFFVHADRSAASGFAIGDPEGDLHEILSFSYEAALEAGLAPRKAFAIIENWLAIEQLRLRDSATTGHRELSR
jgi:hypothetical protein